MADVPFVETPLGGFFDPAFVRPDERVELRVDEPVEGMIVEDVPSVRMHDARSLQSLEGDAFCEARFFEAHGFVLLHHESEVEDWDLEPVIPPATNELMRVYHPEVEALIRERLLPDRRLEIWQGPPTRRGPGTPNPFYATGVHADFGVTLDDYQEGLEVFTGPEIARAWRSRYEADDVEGFLMIDFWRTAGMKGPLEHMPLGVCDPASVRLDDLVPLAVLGITPTGRPTNQLAVRFDEAQRWYSYPRMTPDEVLAFKQFERFKDEAEPRVSGCFHSAFEEPGTPAGAAERQSSEHRVSVFCLR